MAQFPITVAGVQIGLIDTADRASKDPGANSFPQATPNKPGTSGAATNSQVNFSGVNGSNQIINSIQNPG